MNENIKALNDLFSIKFLNETLTGYCFTLDNECNSIEIIVSLTDEQKQKLLDRVDFYYND